MASLFDYHRLAEIVLQWLGDAEIKATNFVGKERNSFLAFRDRAVKFLDGIGRMEMSMANQEERGRLEEELAKEFNALREEARKLGLSSAALHQLGGQF